jgi:D-arabinose 1-dehydrogenase-like Zn-dependent alcohol dehydrogenase
MMRMKAAVIVRAKAPWEIQDLKDPIPQAGQVLIKIIASGICGTDVHVHQGAFPVSFPIVAGHEPVGRIVQLGPGVVDLKVGDRVGVSWSQKGCGRCMLCQERHSRYCHEAQTWMNLGGGNAELMLAWSDGCTLLPENLPDVLAAPLFCAGYTIASGYANAQPKSLERIAVLGFGGLGHLAVQYAKAKGHPVLVLTHSLDKAKEAKALGADEVIQIKDNVGKALLAAGGADIILHTANSSIAANQALEGLLPEGRLVVMALDPNAIQALPIALIHKQIKIIGSLQSERRDLVDILNLAAQGKVKPIVETYALSQVNEVIQRLIDGKVRYRAVLQVAKVA